ncbi:coiled-coil domain-containing protein 115-like [Cylas formicarius]|uniref:coiled-coil domain-containing protein 115-like n=1 Tax=Cylas formicarius TaxID=197179 RepID=UPI00295840A8|nr:coiled-coil domain-containing protein 115-like [Cylas formicarius]
MVEKAEDLDKICDVLDRLTLDALTMMQEEIELKINAENAMIGGEMHLVKSRYILGQNNVSALQLPSENGHEASALVKVHETEDEFGLKQFDLESNKPDETRPNPIRWFGYLTPQSLSYAQNLYRQALQWIVQAGNVQLRLTETCAQIEILKKLKRTVLFAK